MGKKAIWLVYKSLDQVVLSHNILYRLTAYVLKYLHMTVTSQWSEDVYVPISIINDMAMWLAEVQHSSGAWYEPTGVYYNINYFVSATEFCVALPFTQLCSQPLVNDTDGNPQNWSIPVTANVVIVLASATRLTGVGSHCQVGRLYYSPGHS